MVKVRFIFLPVWCVILLILSACHFEIDAVSKVTNNDISVKTSFGDELHFDISTYANLHHQFIKYKISLSNVSEEKNNVVNVVLRDQPKAVYNNPLSIFTEICTEDNISLYKLDTNYIFIYDNYIATYLIEDELFKGCTEEKIIEIFKEFNVN